MCSNSFLDQSQGGTESDNRAVGNSHGKFFRHTKSDARPPTRSKPCATSDARCPTSQHKTTMERNRASEIVEVELLRKKE